ncbi:MAG TPA: hypothetical protein VGR91_17305 [Stellaceae bacterium]|nr:hypothetical protein [Stellaceae bacterium]
MIPGTAIAMGGREWIVPPLTLGQLRQLLPKLRRLSAVGAAMGEDEIGVLGEIVTAAMSRNYPEITAATVEELIDLGNAREVLAAILEGSGLRRQANSPGEAAAGRPIGEASTASSPPPADTAIR